MLPGVIRFWEYCYLMVLLNYYLGGKYIQSFEVNIWMQMQSSLE